MAWIRRLRAIFEREKLIKELEEELEFHLSMREQLNVEQGMPHGEACREARRRFGNSNLWRERMSEIDLMILPQTLLLDLRYGGRMFCRNAGFTIVAVLALALGIGVNTAAFTAYKAMIARSLDARDPRQMVNLALIRHSGVTDPMFSYLDYEAYRDHLHSFTGLIAESHEHERLTLSGAGGIVSQRSSAAGSLVGRLGLLASNASDTEFASTFTVSETISRFWESRPSAVAPSRLETFQSWPPFPRFSSAKTTGRSGLPGSPRCWAKPSVSTGSLLP